MNHTDLEENISKELEEQILFDAIEEEVNKELINNETLNDEKVDDNIEEVKPKKRKRKKITSKKIKENLKIRTVILLLLTLIVNTYAWFIYVSTVSTSMDVHVKSWEFELSNGDQNEDFVFAVEQIYPGMEDAVQVINAKNNGEAEANLSCEVTSIKILDQTYTVGDLYEEDGVTKEITSDDLLNRLLNEYPFKIQIYLNDILYDGKETIMQTGDSTTIKFMVLWDYEKGDTEDDIELNDEIDTKWGNDAYNYYQNGGSKYCIEVKIHIEAVQTKDAP